jgi:hypothetical protein
MRYCIHDPAAQRDRQPAHGSRLPGSDHGCTDPLPPHGAASTRCGRSARTTRASPRRWWSSASSPPRARTARTRPRRVHRPRLGMEGAAPGARSPASCAGLARLRTGVPRTLHDGRGLLAPPCRRPFIRLYREGLIYRGQRLVNWDPALHTAISDLEVISEEENGNLWHSALSAQPMAAAHLDRRHDAARDHARRQRRRRAPGRRTLRSTSWARRKRVPLCD